MNVIFSLVEEANSILWGAPMLAVLVFSGGYFTLRTGGMQFRRWLFCLRATVFSKSSRNSSGSGVTPFQAMASSLAATLGTGNIAGVAAALTSGGAGGGVLDVGDGSSRNYDGICGERTRRLLPQEKRRGMARRRDVLHQVRPG